MARRSQPRRSRPRVSQKSVGIDAEGRLDEATLRRFVFQTFGRARRTQDSPVMPDVWLRYIRVAEKIANDPAADRSDNTIDLLLTPWSGARPGKIATQLRDNLKPEKKRGRKATDDGRLNRARIALSDSRVVACVDFETLVCDVVPMTGWWQRLLAKQPFAEQFERIKETVATNKMPAGRYFELSRYAALVGFIDCLMDVKSQSQIMQLAKLAHRLGPPTSEAVIEQEGQERDIPPDGSALLRDLYKRAERLITAVDPPNGGDDDEIFMVSLNRRAAQTLFESRATIKADAANHVFSINTSGIVFAVIDGGIEATHPAFLQRSEDKVKERIASGEELSDDFCLEWSRVTETYDFTILRDIIASAQEQEVDSARIKWLKQKNKTAFSHLRTRNDNARDLDWEIVRPLIRIQHGINKRKSEGNDYRRPGTDHGTHVAGILAADLPHDADSGRELKGMCPQLSLFDLRVFDENGHGDEYAILCAIEFVGWLNRDRANPVVHGVNLSLALAHDVDSFACGQTPICEACNHLVGAGTVVVTAAGNTGFEGGAGVEKQSMGTGYRAISITDPGNADSVITVGSTHRRDPHLYGVSYFSARGPTGDGRRKPDLLAPGEKITSTIREGGSQRMDGTSMASPHVAGAAALLMSRYPELIGRPLRIKEILMRTATDLNREPSFQGAGLVDVLRALQSV